MNSPIGGVIVFSTDSKKAAQMRSDSENLNEQHEQKPKWTYAVYELVTK